ncbi:TonB-dependent receptor [Lutibacter sp. TH_r2]|uniref:TonB-dependent receptor n=1 Tax=Lutibacter sp. TH_r2 TaxID=3082083 RepID=UPI002954C395|nr:TonB-dependent receptor [Lutibacter sp. TH_r2]MDV7186941.1 TonB-dependent receptor [Lutibacter sp. TH_r2]
MKQFLKLNFKKVKLLVAFLIIATTASAQDFYKLSGKVYNENKQPLPNATVKLLDQKKATATDSDGNFEFQLNKGNYAIEVSYIGYETKMQLIEIINSNQKVDFYVAPSTEKLNEVLVSAVRVKPSSPVTHSNVTKEELEKRNLGQDIPVLLNYLPSVTSSSDAGAGVGYTYIRVRGSDASRINVTLNGIPYNDTESQGTFWVNLGDFTSSTQSMQLQRGVGTSTNGSGAFGASLNLLTDAISDEAYGEISSAIGSYNTYKNTIKFSTGKINDHIEIAGRFSKIDSDGYVDRAFSDLKSYFLQASYVDDNTLIKAITFGNEEKTYQAWYGLSAEELKEDRKQNPYTYDNETDNYWQDHYQLHWNETLNENWSTNLGLNYTKGKGYFEQYKEGSAVSKYNNIVEATGTDWYGTPATDLIVRRWLDNDFYVLNFNANYKNEEYEVISGISASNYKGDHFGEVIWARQFAADANIRDQYYFSDATKNEFSIYSKASFKVNKNLSALVDLQGRFVNYETDGLTSDRDALNIDKSYSFFNPKVGLTYKINNNNSIYTSFARANREPNRDDFKNGPDVQNEILNDFELGWRLKNEAVSLNTNFYYMQYKNQLIQTGGLNDVGEYLRENVDDSYRLGLEIDANIKLSSKFSISPNLTLSSNKIKNFILERDDTSVNIGTTNIAFSPDIIAGNSINYQPAKNLSINFLSKFVGEQYMSNTDTEASKLDSYFTSDLNLTYEIKPKSIFKSIVLSGLVNNVFNKEYVDRGYTYLDYWSTPGNSFEVQGYYPQATRNFLVGATFKF